jgi:RNA polymerase sigma-70 factor (ECF subfamily)
MYQYSAVSRADPRLYLAPIVVLAVRVLPLLELLLLLAVAIPAGEEEGLAIAIKSGDRTAFRRFFEAHHEALLRYLIHRRVSPDVAEDLVQNAFVHIWENRASIKPGGSLRGLLFRIGYTRALNHFRDTSRFADVAPEDAPVSVAEESQDPAERDEVRALVQAAVAVLPERRRAVFELCILQDLSYAEAAEALGISRKTVENHMGYALKAVRARLAGLRDA